jgi:protein-tyrosine kinase
MSEIFEYLLGRTEKGMRVIPTKASMLPPVSLSAGESDDDSKISGPVRDSLDLTTQAQPEIRGNASFNLDLADYRVRSVLDPVTAVGEQFRLLRAKLSLEQKQRNIKTLLVSSASPAEGKTFVSCGLAGVLAQEPGKKVLLVDADMRRPMAGRDLGVQNLEIKGLSDVLRGEAAIEDVLINSTDTTLFLLPSGNTPHNPSELLSSPALESSLKSVSQYFDWIIIDSPPIAAIADASVIAQICDAILLVVQANKTLSKLVQNAILRVGQDRICGIVMNRVKYITNSRYYYRYYHVDSKQR